MLAKFFVLGAALIVTAPVLATSGGASAGPSTTATASGGHAGGSAGGSAAGGGGGHGAGLGAHGAAMSTHLGGPSHGATAHSVTGRATQSQHVAIADKTSKKPGHDHNHDHASHLFLHRTAYNNTQDWTQLCLSSYSEADGRWWADCNRPAKSSSKPHT
jgi:hypothetical protein